MAEVIGAPRRYAALLRGVNVGAASRVAMPHLRQIVAGLGHSAVTTYLNSGNVVFTASGDPAQVAPAEIADEIERGILDHLGLAVPVVLRSGAELAALIADNPYPPDESDERKLLVAFLAEEPAPQQVAQLTVPVGEAARFTLAGRHVFLHCPNGFGRTKLNNAYLEQKLKVVSTTRNWRTVRALAAQTAG